MSARKRHGTPKAVTRRKLEAVTTLAATTLTALAITVLATPGCDGEETTGPEPGTLELTLNSPYADDAAIIVAVDGPGIEAVEAADVDAYIHVVEDGTARTVVLVAERLPPGVILQISVPDVGALDEYTATLLQAADTANGLRASVDGYGVTIGAPTE